MTDQVSSQAAGATKPKRRARSKVARWFWRNPYVRYEKPAGNIKARIQMLLGLGLFLVLVLRLSRPVILHFWPSPRDCLKNLLDAEPLWLISHGLMYSAGIELCYMLFTDGPDEAIHPVILGLASAILLILSDEYFDWRDAIIVPILCLSMVALFWIDANFFPKKKR